CNPPPLGPLVPRSRRPTADAGVGRRGRRGDAVLPVLVDRHVPRPGDLHRRAGLQLPRRFAAGRARPAVVVTWKRRHMTALLEVEGLRVRLPTPKGQVTIVDGVDYSVQPSEVFGVA